MADKVNIAAQTPRTGSILKSSSGWDGKLRIAKSATVVQDEGSGSEDSDQAGYPVEEIEADEGNALAACAGLHI